MAYIGREPQIGNYQVCDAISVVNAQAAYTMQVSSVNVIPESVNHMIVSLNGVIQKPGSSYTISSSTITFSSNLATGDSIDFIYLLGNVLDLGTPSDDTVTGAKIVDNAINSEHYTDASIDLAHLSADSVDGSKIVDNAINSEHYTDGSIDTAHIADAQVTLAKLAADSVNATKIGDDAINSEHYTDGSIDTAHIADLQITSGKIAAGLLGGTIAFRAHNGSTTQNISNGTTTQVNLGTESFDIGGNFANSTFTVPSGGAGKYVLTCAARADASWAATDNLIVRMYVGANDDLGGGASNNIPAAHGGSVNIQTIANLADGDTVKMYVYHDEGGTEGLQVGPANTFMSGVRIGA